MFKRCIGLMPRFPTKARLGHVSAAGAPVEICCCILGPCLHANGRFVLNLNFMSANPGRQRPGPAPSRAARGRRWDDCAPALELTVPAAQTLAR